MLNAIFTLPGLAGIILGALGSFINEWLTAYRRDQALREAGASSVSVTVNRESADASQRMAESNAQIRTRDSVLGRLDDGSA